MKTPNAIHRATPGRKKQIIEAALLHFARSGVEAAAVEDIARDAESSVSSIYHHFGSKELLAAAVYCEGIARFQEGYVRALEAKTGAKAGVVAIVSYHLDWVVANPEWARYLFDTRRRITDASQEEAVAELNKAFHARLGLWFGPRIQAGAMRRLPFDTFVAMLVGPCQELARAWLRGEMVSGLAEVKKSTAEAVWRALGKD
ncbi:TetR/AcrR family transcriptional regulator [Herbaspirillum sp. HC18]|nr:TetR/AcrR family transcriptional regulator [Herbaspirillum sp. HC18]